MLFPATERSQERLLRYLWAIFEAVQMEGALLEMRVLREMHRLPEDGKANPLVVSADGVYYDSDALLEQLVLSKTHRSLAQTFKVPVELYFRVSKFIWSKET